MSSFANDIAEEARALVAGIRRSAGFNLSWIDCVRYSGAVDMSLDLPWARVGIGNLDDRASDELGIDEQTLRLDWEVFLPPDPGELGFRTQDELIAAAMQDFHNALMASEHECKIQGMTRSPFFSDGTRSEVGFSAATIHSLRVHRPTDTEA